ncbi:MAG TPA: TRAP transporter small permease [Thermodesulfobacteriota bacterium]|nr:TRAP transporter small permease [Thermodesulfobacteriota bacterium]
MKNSVENVLGKCEEVLTYIAVLSIFVMMCLTTVDAIGRYIFNYPITGAYEFTEKYLMLTAVYLGASYTYRGGSTIRITLLVSRMPPNIKIGLNIFAQIVSICYGFFLVVPNIQSLYRTYLQGTTLTSTSFPLWPPYVAIPVGLLLMSLFMLWDLPKVPKGKSALFNEEEFTDTMREDNLGKEGSK